MTARRDAVKVFGFAGWSGSGKTTLIEQLVPILVERAGRVSLVKQSSHALHRPCATHGRRIATWVSRT